jgi:hypothetical protein
MKSIDEKTEQPIQIRRYSDHPVVKKKVAEARRFLAKSDLSFLNNPSKKK